MISDKKMEINSYKDLLVWQKAHQLVKLIIGYLNSMIATTLQRNNIRSFLTTAWN